MKNLKEIYKDKNGDGEWFDLFYKTGSNMNGKCFECFSTNIRTLSTYCAYFKKFNEINEIPRKNWDKNPNGQEVHKQYVMPMLESKLFAKVINTEYGFGLTDKGRFYQRVIDSDIKGDEFWILNLLCLSDGYYGGKVNNLIETSQKIRDMLITIDYPNEKIDSDLIKITECKNKDELFGIDLFYLINFFRDKELLLSYFNAKDAEKQELKEYILDNLKNKNYICVISKKMKNGGVYSFQTAIEEIKIFYVINNILLPQKSPNIELIVEEYGNKFKCNIDNLKGFTNEVKNKKIIEDILENSFDSVYETNFEKEITQPQKQGEDKKISTVVRDRGNINRPEIKELYGHKCALSETRGCESQSFLNKTDNKPYVEIHHLVPISVRNSFTNSLEVNSNYVILCPGCHKFIHRASDEVRKPILQKLFKDRKDKLSKDGVSISEPEFLNFYDFD